MKLLKPLIIVSFVLLLIACSNSESNNRIAKNTLGQVDQNTAIYELKGILVEDSLHQQEPDRFNRNQDLEVYNSRDSLILLIEPRVYNDSTSTIKEIQILGGRFKTETGLSSQSKYGEIYKNHKISNIQNSINSVILTLEDLGAYIVIDKKHLPSELRFDNEAKIEANQIPNDAPIKYFWLRFTEDVK
ncbi:hypothetical protein [Psychroflexus aestuariivivens]|uniref:hypothetical protein n=1 Tax=Psychroflexus aestuariivivens TaxID=1795040 RepID=UPI000FD83F54|nr:hypothetical protein [Psychroflexus aestuariivivens]